MNCQGLISSAVLPFKSLPFLLLLFLLHHSVNQVTLKKSWKMSPTTWSHWKPRLRRYSKSWGRSATGLSGHIVYMLSILIYQVSTNKSRHSMSIQQHMYRQIWRGGWSLNKWTLVSNSGSNVTDSCFKWPWWQEILLCALQVPDNKTFKTSFWLMLVCRTSFFSF